jgi:hypothetical protein
MDEIKFQGWGLLYLKGLVNTGWGLFLDTEVFLVRYTPFGYHYLFTVLASFAYIPSNLQHRGSNPQLLKRELSP